MLAGDVIVGRKQCFYGADNRSSRNSNRNCNPQEYWPHAFICRAKENEVAFTSSPCHPSFWRLLIPFSSYSFFSSFLLRSSFSSYFIFYLLLLLLLLLFCSSLSSSSYHTLLFFILLLFSSASPSS